MSIITITLNNKEFKLFCPKENHEELRSLAISLDIEISKVRELNPSASFELLLVMLALGFLDSQKKQSNSEAKDILKDTGKDYQLILSSVFNELKIIAEKLEQ